MDEYQIISSERIAVTQALSNLWEKFGRPSSPLSKSGKKLVDVLIATWEDLFPEESKIWHEQRKNYKAAELDIKQQIKGHTGRSLASYPMYIHKMLKVLFPEFDHTERKNCIKMVKEWPMFQFANKV